MDKEICEKCGAVLKHYDRVTRIVKGKGGVKSYIHVERYRCPKCKTCLLYTSPSTRDPKTSRMTSSA